MEGWSFDALDDPKSRDAAEPAFLRMASHMASLPPEAARRFGGMLPAFVRLVALHWPPGPDRPAEVVALVERFGESPQ